MPVGTRHRHDLERAEEAGVGDVGTGAEILPVRTRRTGDVERDARRALGDGAFGIVALVLVARGALEALVRRHLTAGEGALGLDDLPHLRLDGGEVGISEHPGFALGVDHRHVVEEALIDGRAVGEARLRPQGADGLGQDMGAGMAQHEQGIGVVIGCSDDDEMGVLGNGGIQIADDAGAVGGEFDRDGTAGEAGADGFGNLPAGDRPVEGEDLAVGKGDAGHGGNRLGNGEWNTE